jgi:RNA polymerase sigma-70 factor (ECF subfamily)
MTRDRLDPRQRERFERLAWPWLDTVLRTARYLTRSDDVAEDLAQETMLKAMKAIDRFQDGTDMKAWLMTILRRTHIDRIRTEQRRADDVSLDADPSLGPSSGDDPVGVFDEHWDEPQQLLGRFEDQTIIDALKKLPEAIRWTLLLVDVEQMEQSDAARILEVPIGTIKSRAYRGRRMLRDELYQLAQQRGWVNIAASPSEP